MHNSMQANVVTHMAYRHLFLFYVNPGHMYFSKYFYYRMYIYTYINVHIYIHVCLYILCFWEKSFEVVVPNFRFRFILFPSGKISSQVSYALSFSLNFLLFSCDFQWCSFYFLLFPFPVAAPTPNPRKWHPENVPISLLSYLWKLGWRSLREYLPSLARWGCELIFVSPRFVPNFRFRFIFFRGRDFFLKNTVYLRDEVQNES